MKTIFQLVAVPLMLNAGLAVEMAIVCTTALATCF
jgi:hypothetical protein